MILMEVINMKTSSSNERIKELLRAVQMSQTEFCEYAKITKSALSNYLNGDRQPRQDQIDKIAQAFNVDPSWLMGYNVPMYDEAKIGAEKAEERLSVQKLSEQGISHERLMAYYYLLSRMSIQEFMDVAQHCNDKQIRLAVEMLKSIKKTDYMEK